MLDVSRKIGVLLVGMSGSVANTIICGCQMAKRDNLPVFGMFTESEAFAHTKFVDWREFNFSGWDVDRRSAYEVANAGDIVPRQFLTGSKDELSALSPLTGALAESDYYYSNSYSRSTRNFTLSELLEGLNQDISEFKKSQSLDACYIVNVASPTMKVIRAPSEIGKIELRGMIDSNSKLISSATLYALAALDTGCGFIDFTSSQTLEIAGLHQIALDKGVQLAGRDGATGETSLKMMLSEFLLKRNLRVTGWFSTNILGNNDGKVLKDNSYGDLKFTDKKSIAPDILGYSDFDNIVNIEYYRPRGDNKEAWNVIDFKGWLGLEMSIRIDWQGRDSILAAPLILDLVRHMDYSREHGEKGLLYHLGVYFKHPIGSKARGFSEAYNLLLDHYR